LWYYTPCGRNSYARRSPRVNEIHDVATVHRGCSVVQLVDHFFNHQTHHRGQAHCLITQAGVKPEDTDLPWVVDLQALGLE